MPIIKIDYNLCTNCNICVEECSIRLLMCEDGIVKPRGDRVEGIKNSGSVIEYNAPGCANCRMCEIFCPGEAITIEV